MDGDAYPTDTPLTANSTNSISRFVVIRESVLLAAQGVSVGKVGTRISSRPALMRDEHADSPPRQFPPHSAPSLAGRGWLIHYPVLAPPSMRAQRGPSALGEAQGRREDSPVNRAQDAGIREPPSGSIPTE